MVIIQNYDMDTGAMLILGSDVWLNNSHRPKEASGTSVMKAAMNGVLNFSTLDGWWPEACEHGVNGWQMGDGYESRDLEELDHHDRKALYQVLTEDIIPTYYDHRDRWVEMMKASILSKRDQFAIKRMLKQYYELLYTV